MNVNKSGEPSSISLTISSIKKEVDSQNIYSIQKLNENLLHNYNIGVNKFRHKIYIEAEIRPDCLDKGTDPIELATTIATQYGALGDHPFQLIGKKLGGDGSPHNVFPLSSELDLTQWKADENVVYSHVKKGDNYTAHLIFSIKYYKEKYVCRPGYP